MTVKARKEPNKFCLDNSSLIQQKPMQKLTATVKRSSISNTISHTTKWRKKEILVHH